MTSWSLIYNCIERSETPLGSSKDWPEVMPAMEDSGIMDHNNPNNKFRFWNVAFI